MKKLIVVLLAGLIVLSFAACTEEPNTNESSNYISEVTSSVKSQAPESSSLEEITSENVLVDNEYCKAVFINFEYTDNDIRMHLTVQNKTDKEIGITIDNIAMDGIMSGMPEEINIESNQTTDITCFIGYDYHTVSCGLENKNISMVEFSIRIWDPETYKHYYEETHILYPLGEDAAQKKVYVPADTDVVLLDNDVCKISFIKGEKEEYAYYLYLYIENKTDKTLAFDFLKSKVNGTLTGVTDSIPKITPQNTIYYTPSFWQLEEDGISEVETIELPVVAYSLDNFAEPAVEETFTIIP